MVRDEMHPSLLHVADKQQFHQVSKLFNDYYNFKEPAGMSERQKQKHKTSSTYKKMSLRDIDRLSNAKNILKFDLDRKLSKHLNKLLSLRKDDPYFNDKYLAHMRKQPDHEAPNKVFNRLSLPLTDRHKAPAGTIDHKINLLRAQVKEQIAKTSHG